MDISYTETVDENQNVQNEKLNMKIVEFIWINKCSNHHHHHHHTLNRT